MNLFKNVYKYNLLGYLIGWISFCTISFLDVWRSYSPPENGYSDMTWTAYQAVVIIMFVFEIGIISFVQSIIFWLILKSNRLTYKNIKSKIFFIFAIIYNILLYVCVYIMPSSFVDRNYITSLIIPFVIPLVLISVAFYSYVISIKHRP